LRWTTAAAEGSHVKNPGNELPQPDIDRLMDVAAEMFAEFGFDGVSVRAIARAAGWTAPLVFYHFTSKANLYEEVFAHKIDQSIEEVDDRLRGITDRQQRLRVFVEALCDLYIGHRPLLALMQRDLAESSVKLGRLRSRRQYEHYTSLIHRSLADGAGHPVSDELAFMTGALILGFCELSIAVEDPDDLQSPEALQRHKERLVRAVHRLVGGVT
jgi:AcrR family transcriptional regulator